MPETNKRPDRLLIERLDEGVTGRLTTPAPNGVGLQLYLMSGELLAAHADDDDTQLLRRLVARDILSPTLAGQLHKKTAEEPLADSLFDHVEENLLMEILFDRFKENVARFLVAAGPVSFQGLDAIFVANLQVSHNTEDLLKELQAIVTRTRPLMALRVGGHLLTRGSVAPPGDNAAELILYQLLASPRPLDELFLTSPYERFETLDVLTDMFSTGMVQVSHPDWAVHVPASSRRDEPALSSVSGSASAPSLSDPDAVDTLPPGALEELARQAAAAQPLTEEPRTDEVPAPPPTAPSIDDEAATESGLFDPMDGAVQIEEEPETPLIDDAFPAGVQDPFSDIEAEPFSDELPEGMDDPFEDPPLDTEDSPLAAHPAHEPDSEPETGDDFGDPFAGEFGDPFAIDDHRLGRRDRDDPVVPLNLKGFTQGPEASVIHDELSAFEDYDYVRGGEDGSGHFVRTTNNTDVTLDRVDLSMVLGGPTESAPSGGDEEEIIELADAEDLSPDERGAISMNFSGPQLTNTEASRKLGVMNQVLGQFSTAFDAQGGRGLGSARVQLLLDGSPSEFSTLFHEVEAADDGTVSVNEVLANLRRRPPTEHRRLLDRGLLDLIERALTAAVDSLEDEAIETFLENIAGYQQRLR